MRYAIGDFSKLTHLSVKALRLYHEEGILLPSSVDRDSGYRYYDERCLEQARVIGRLKELGFALKEIREIVGLFSDDAQLNDILRRKMAEVEARIAHYGRIRKALAAMIRQEREYDSLQRDAGIVIRNLPDMHILGLRFRGRYREVGGHLGKLARQAGRQFRGPVFSLYFDGDYREDDADIEAGVGLKGAIDKGDLHSRLLPGGRALTLLHYGPYETIGLSYKKIFDFIGQGGLRIQLPTRELYRHGPGLVFYGNAKKFVTEIQMLLAPGESTGGAGAGAH